MRHGTSASHTAHIESAVGGKLVEIYMKSLVVIEVIIVIIFGA